jgi:hypothetical protein
MLAKGCAWCAIAAAGALIWSLAGAAASGQTRPDVAYDRAAMIEAICRQYATLQTGMPTDLMFNQCMSERHCRVSPGSPGYQCEVPGPLEWHGGGY